MCAQGIKWNTQEKLAIGANTDADTVIAGYDNETIVGVKTETLVGGWGVGVGGLKTEVIAGAQIGAVGGWKVDYNYGQRYDYSFGYKFDRSPIGTVESVGDFWHWNHSHTMTAGTSFIVVAGETATIHAGTISFAGTASVMLSSCVEPANTANPRTSCELTPAGGAITFAQDPALGLAPAALSVAANMAVVSHPTQVNLACSAPAPSSITLLTGMLQLNAAQSQMNGSLVQIGMPPSFNAAVTTALVALAAQNQTLLLLAQEAQLEAQEAAEAEAAVSAP